MAGAQAGLGVGVLTPYRNMGSLQGVLPAIQKKLILASLISFASFTLISVYQMIFANLKT